MLLSPLAFFAVLLREKHGGSTFFGLHSSGKSATPEQTCSGTLARGLQLLKNNTSVGRFPKKRHPRQVLYKRELFKPVSHETYVKFTGFKPKPRTNNWQTIKPAS